MDELKITSGMNGRRVKHVAPSGKKRPNASRGRFNEVLDQVSQKSAAPTSGSDKTKKSIEIRRDLVDKYRLDLKNGAYNVRATEIADKIVQKIRDDKSKF